MKIKMLTLLIAAYTLGAHMKVHAQGFTQKAKVVASNRAEGDDFGGSVSIDGDYAIVGAVSTGISQGSAYILKRDGSGDWNEIKVLSAVSTANNDIFGKSVYLSGDFAIVGATGDDEDGNEMNFISDAGAAYIFGKDQGGTDNWGLVQKIVHSDRAASDRFGVAVSMSGNYALIGANFEDHDADGNNNLAGAGSAYIFERNTTTGVWSEVKKLVASDRASDDWFGVAVDISGDHAVIGAYRKNSLTGAAYIFKKDQGGADNWGELKALSSSDNDAGDWFGVSVAIDGDNALVTSNRESTDALGQNTINRAGAAYVFEKNQGGAENWGLAQKLVASDREEDDFFGEAGSLSGEMIIIGADIEDHDADGNNFIESAGSAYIFRKDVGGNWNEIQKIVASDRDVDDVFGGAVGISGDYVIVGSDSEDHDAGGNNFLEDAGSVYLFEFGDSDPPVFTSASTISILENSIQTLTVTMTDVSNVTLSIVESADDDEFELNATNGMLTFRVEPDFENPTDFDSDNVYEVQILAEDDFGNQSTQNIEVTVINIVDETPPVFTSSTEVTIPENSTDVFTIMVTDESAITYSIIGGTEAALLLVGSTSGEVTFINPPDFETPLDTDANNTYVLEIEAMDADGNEAIEEFTITVTDIDEVAPVFTSAQSVEVSENSSTVQDVQANDASAVTYAISAGGDATLFTIDSNSGALSFLMAPDFENPTDSDKNNVYEVTIQATDENGNISTQMIQVAVTDIDDTAPTFTSASTLSLEENLQLVQTVTATDASTVTLTIVGGTDASLFSIDPSSGVLSFQTAPDFESPTDQNGDNNYEVVVQATDAAGNASQIQIVITITDLDENIVTGIAFDGEPQISVYPNPTTKHLFVEGESEWREIKVVDMSGMEYQVELMPSVGHSKMVIDLLRIPDGIYVLQLTGDRGQYNLRFIKN